MVHANFLITWRKASPVYGIWGLLWMTSCAYDGIRMTAQSLARIWSSQGRSCKVLYHSRCPYSFP